MSTRIKAEPQTHLSTTWPHAEIANLKAENTRLQSALATARREALEEAGKTVREAADDTIRAFILLVPEREQHMTLDQFAKAMDEIVERIRALLSQSVEGNNA